MLIEDLSYLLVEQIAVPSGDLNRQVIVDFYLPKNIENPSTLSLLIINDGQNLDEMPFASMLNGLIGSGQIRPLLCVGVHAGKDRKNEYGISTQADYEGRGARAGAYEHFLVNKLLPFVHNRYAIDSFQDRGIAGFSLGGLTALDLCWKHPDIFTTCGVFSGSLWWRSKPLGPEYNDDTDRIMHQLIRKGKHHPGLRFYFTTGSLDETADRNQNGIIDSIDDTQDIMAELEKKGYDKQADIRYLNFEDGRHDIETWGRALPGFLLWGWGSSQQ